MASFSMDGILQPTPAAPKESLEGLQNQLLCTCTELEYMRKASEAQAKLNDAKLQHMQEMLDMTKKERDKAFQECKELQELLFQMLTDAEQLDSGAQGACPTSSSRHATCVYPSSGQALPQSTDSILEAEISDVMHTLSEAKHTLPTEACECSFTINTPEQYDLTFLTEEKALQENGSFSDSQEQFSMDIFSENAAFDQLPSLVLAELQAEENLVANWEADLTESWEVSLSTSPSSETSTAASQLRSRKNDETIASAKIQTSTTPSTKISADTQKDTTSADISTMASQEPTAATQNTMPSLPCPSRVAMSPHAPISMQACVSPQMLSLSPSQPASTMPHVCDQSSIAPLPSIPSMSACRSAPLIAKTTNHLSIAAELSPSAMSAVLPSSSMSNHLSTSANPVPPKLSMSASQSMLPIANMYSHMSMSAKPLPSIPAMSASQSTSLKADVANPLSILAEVSPATPAMSASQHASPIAEPSPLALFYSSARAIPSWGMTSSQYAAVSASQYTSMTRHSTALSSQDIRPTPSSAVASASFPHYPTYWPLQASANIKKTKQARTSVHSQRRQHLPEPPEAKMEVMLSSLPEKGKLLQAVIEAGPLLQQLLLAGPLPQWNYPPPQLNTAHILRVPTSPDSVLSPFSHVKNSSCHPSPLAFTCKRKRLASCNLPYM